MRLAAAVALLSSTHGVTSSAFRPRVSRQKRREKWMTLPLRPRSRDRESAALEDSHTKKASSRRESRSKKRIRSLWEQEPAEDDAEEATVVECDPREIDVGILSCEPGSVCEKAPGSSSLGGFCVVQNDARRLDGTIETSAPTPYGTMETSAPPSYSNYGSYCDYTNFDTEQLLGTYVCTDVEGCYFDADPICGVFPETVYQYAPGPTNSTRIVGISGCFQGNNTNNNYVCYGYTSTYDIVTNETVSVEPNSCTVSINGCDCICVYTNTTCFDPGPPILAGFDVNCGGISISSFSCPDDRFIKEASEAAVPDCGSGAPAPSTEPPMEMPAANETVTPATTPAPIVVRPSLEPTAMPILAPVAEAESSSRMTRALHLMSVVMGAVLAWSLF